MSIQSHEVINILLGLSGLLDLCLAVFVLATSTRKPVNYVFGICALFVSAWTIGILMFRLSGDISLALFWNREYIITAGFIASTFLHFSYLITGTKLTNRQVVFIHLPAVLLGVAVFFPGAFIQTIYVRDWGKESILGYLYPLYGGYYFIYASWALLKIFNAARRVQGAIRTQLIYILTGALITLSIGMYFNLILILLGNYQLVWVGPYNSFFMVAIIAYAITKHELMDIKLLVTRSTAYIVAFVSLAVSFLIVNYLVSGVIWLVLFNTALALFWGLYYVPLRKLIQTPLEEKWITDRYDADKIINSIALKLVSVLDYRQVFQIITAEIKNTIKIKEAFFIIARRNNKMEISVYEAIRDSKLESETMPVQYPFIETMKYSRRPFLYDDLDVYVKNTMSGYEFPHNALLLPLSSATELEGIIVLGQKISEDRYSEKDLLFFQTIISYSLAVLDRVKPYEKAKSEFEASQKKLYDTERQLARSEKLSAMASMIQQYNHEIRTPLSIARMKVDRMVSPEEFEENKEGILKQIDRAVDIVDTTLSLTPGYRERQEMSVNINDVIQKAVRLVPPNGYELKLSLIEVPVISGVESDLVMVFTNLLKNAQEAMPDGGVVTITTMFNDKDKVINITVADTGKGIAEKDREKVWEPYYSGNVTKGRGLGLSIVFRIIREHLGKIDFVSQLGKGTTFNIQLPVKI